MKQLVKQMKTIRPLKLQFAASVGESMESDQMVASRQAEQIALLQTQLAEKQVALDDTQSKLAAAVAEVETHCQRVSASAAAEAVGGADADSASDTAAAATMASEELPLAEQATGSPRAEAVETMQPPKTWRWWALSRTTMASAGTRATLGGESTSWRLL